MRRSVLFVFSAISVASYSGCDFGDMSDSESTTELSLHHEMYITNGRLDATGRHWSSLASLRVLDEAGEPYRSLTGHAGLWMASENNTIEASAFGKGNFGFEFAPIQNDSTGFFIITRDSLITSVSNWPTGLGAPSDAFGQPRLYGDVMGWSLFQPDTSSLYVMKDVAIGMTTYLFEEQALSEFAFHRVDIINTCNEPISNL